MIIDGTFWVAISFLIFLGVLIYLKIPQKINELLNKLILDIKNEIDESEKLRQEAKVLLDNAQNNPTGIKFIDAYRSTYPDVKQNSGLTYLNKNDTPSRIDYIFYNNRER